MNASEERMSSLMEVFGAIDSTLRRIEDEEQEAKWQPAEGREKEAFDALVAAENREALKAWFAAVPSMNPRADQFRRILERATGDNLPLGR